MQSFRGPLVCRLFLVITPFQSMVKPCKQKLFSQSCRTRSRVMLNSAAVSSRLCGSLSLRPNLNSMISQGPGRHLFDTSLLGVDVDSLCYQVGWLEVVFPMSVNRQKVGLRTRRAVQSAARDGDLHDCPFPRYPPTGFCRSARSRSGTLRAVS